MEKEGKTTLHPTGFKPASSLSQDLCTSVMQQRVTELTNIYWQKIDQNIFDHPSIIVDYGNYFFPNTDIIFSLITLAVDDKIALFGERKNLIIKATCILRNHKHLSDRPQFSCFFSFPMHRPKRLSFTLSNINLVFCFFCQDHSSSDFFSRCCCCTPMNWN